jgi:hypothetical protein
MTLFIHFVAVFASNGRNKVILFRKIEKLARFPLITLLISVAQGRTCGESVCCARQTFLLEATCLYDASTPPRPADPSAATLQLAWLRNSINAQRTR